jgi:magnesium chelatase subunit D
VSRPSGVVANDSTSPSGRSGPTDTTAAGARWSDALRAAEILAVDPAYVGGIWLRAAAGEPREVWLGYLAQLLGPLRRPRRVPLSIPDSRLLGGLDLSATLRAGKAIAERGVLAEANGAVVVVPMAERMSASLAAKIAVTMDAGQVATERDGVSLGAAARFGAVLLDEGLGAEECPPRVLTERLAIRVDLNTMPARLAATEVPADTIRRVLEAAVLVRQVEMDDELIAALAATAQALCIDSLRPVIHATAVTRVAAALAARSSASDPDAALAARLVLAPRARSLPQAEPAPAPEPSQPDTKDFTDEPAVDRSSADDPPLEDVLLAAALAAVPRDLLAQLDANDTGVRGGAAGRSQQRSTGRECGRPVGARPGEWRDGARLDLVETLRAAVPWQKLRRRRAGSRVQVRSSDFRLTRFQQRNRTTTIFAVDASGSAALHRLAEVKGAVELLLADCYVRRDQVALVAFRAARAEVVLPPTRALARAKRALDGLPGGGGTPLALGLDAARELALAVRRRGDAPRIVVLTDGRANIARSGAPGRAQAALDAEESARALRAAGIACMFIDSSPQPRPDLLALAQTAGARYVALPHADAQSLSQLVRAA